MLRNDKPPSFKAIAGRPADGGREAACQSLCIISLRELPGKQVLCAIREPLLEASLLLPPVPATGGASVSAYGSDRFTDKTADKARCRVGRQTVHGIRNQVGT